MVSMVFVAQNDNSEGQLSLTQIKTELETVTNNKRRRPGDIYCHPESPRDKSCCFVFCLKMKKTLLFPIRAICENINKLRDVKLRY